MAHLTVSDDETDRYPTYKTARRIVNGDLTAPAEFIGWTTLRALLIMPGYALVGLRGKPLIVGALLSSTMISTFALYRTVATKRMYARQAQLGAPSAAWCDRQHRRYKRLAVRNPRKAQRLHKALQRRCSMEMR